MRAAHVCHDECVTSGDPFSTRTPAPAPSAPWELRAGGTIAVVSVVAAAVAVAFPVLIIVLIPAGFAAISFLPVGVAHFAVRRREECGLVAGTRRRSVERSAVARRAVLTAGVAAVLVAVVVVVATFVQAAMALLNSATDSEAFDDLGDGSLATFYVAVALAVGLAALHGVWAPIEYFRWYAAREADPQR